MKSSRKYAFIAALAAVLSIALAGLHASAAEVDEPFWHKDRLAFSLSIFKPEIDTTIRVDSKTLGIGTEIDVEQDLNLDDRVTLPVFEGYWRFTRRQSVEFGYFELDRTGTVDLPKDIDWGDTSFPLGDTVNSEFTTKILWVSYRYSFLHNEKQELAASIGIHGVDLSASLQSGTVGVEENDIVAPLPLIGLAYAYNITPDWTVRASGEWFGIEVNDIKGDIFNLAAAVEWFPWDKVGFQLGYTVFDVEVDSGDSDLEGKFEYEYKGPTLGVTFRF